ncbi:hypothetical protein [Sphingomonas sp. PB4P5]|uniref:hypothetical protein n=1 Tax=Parasphingomonas puruogangriensis TaxID=3096155 RepID=UPI002FCB7757
MITRAEQAALNLQEARALRAAGTPYREIGRALRLSSGQLGHIRRALKREKAGRTRLYGATPDADERDLPVSRSVLPLGLRRVLAAAGYKTLGDIADRLADPNRPGLETLAGVGPHRAALVRTLLDHYGLRSGSSELQAEVERLFPELRDSGPA